MKKINKVLLAAMCSTIIALFTAPSVNAQTASTATLTIAAVDEASFEAGSPEAIEIKAKHEGKRKTKKAAASAPTEATPAASAPVEAAPAAPVPVEAAPSPAK